ncbi:MAG TPA: bifunctional pyr operon transcriptional regulator/uracil phosphoribosyltransferase PyrR [Anaerohalosphaeraceae bacterium]|nr:bifunctional pyr operon transcriptional regulator/uracil phosphoribosyltransferase PyrR [Anaerohalosphaeraceae bacterium]
MRVLLNEAQISQILDSISQDIASDLGSNNNLVIIGIRSRGEILAQRLQKRLSERLGKEIPCGTLDITLYRDDIHDPQNAVPSRVRTTEINFDIHQTTVLLVDDVLHTGRSVRAALDALTDLGRPKAIRLAVLVDRGSRELPIRADYVGIRVDVNPEERVQVLLKETDQIEQVLVE